jgi:GxxExxY protein
MLEFQFQKRVLSSKFIDVIDIRGLEMNLEKFNTETQSHEDTKIENDLSCQIIGASIGVHRTLGGPGLFENIYEAALCHELVLRGLRIQRQRPVQVIYKRVAIKEPLFIDILVEDKVLVEVKAVEKFHPIYETQVLTYLRLTGISAFQASIICLRYPGLTAWAMRYWPFRPFI